jgi:hypothetical protein
MLASFVITIGLIILPWSLREKHWFDTYTLSSTPYINFTQYNLVYFHQYQHGVSYEEARSVYADAIPYERDSLWFRSLINEPIFKQEMHEGLKDNLVPYAQFHLIKALPFFLNDSLRDINRMIGLFPPPQQLTNFTNLLIQRDWEKILSYFKTPSSDLVMLLIGSSVWISVSALCFFAALAAIFMRKSYVWFVLFCLGIVLYFGILSSPVIQPRYRMPAAPFMLLLAVEAGATIALLLKRREAR